MADISWLKQTDEPAFPDLMWSRPENKSQAGKLLIIGGNSHSFSIVSAAYAQAIKAGAGAVRVIAPSALSKSLGQVFPEAIFAPSTPSGSFAANAVADFLDNSAWADGTLLAGDFGKNSETSVAIEKFSDKYKGPLIVSGDVLDNFPGSIERPQTTVVASIEKIQKQASKQGVTIKQTGSLLELVSALQTWNRPSNIITKIANTFVVSTESRVSTTASVASLSEMAAYAAVWQIQQPARQFEVLTCAAFCLAT